MFKWFRGKRSTILGWSIAFLMILILAAQAISDLVSGRFWGRTNYFGQPITPILQLLMFVFFLVVAVLMILAKTKGHKPQKDKTHDIEPKWMDKPPWRFPWE